MRTILALCVLFVGGLRGDDKPKLDAVLYGPFFESNKSGLKGASSYLVFTDRKKFDAVLRLRPPIGMSRAIALPADAFEKSLVLAVIKRGTQIHQYTLKGTSVKEGVYTLTFESKAEGKAGGSAMFASPLVVTVPKGKYKAVEFVENGKKVETIKLD